MKYIKTYADNTAYEADKTKKYPHVGYILSDGSVIYVNEKTDYSKEYLTFEAIDAGEFKLERKSYPVECQYSLDNGSTWTTLANNTWTPTVNAGQTIKFKGAITPRESENANQGGVGTFYATGRFNAMGNPYSMFSGDSFTQVTGLSRYALNELFYNNTYLISAEDISLPCDTMNEKCYRNMFRGCTNLVKAPTELSATTLATYCYNSMFHTCSSLTETPILAATSLVERCYEGMFRYCSSLASITYMALVAPSPTFTYNWADGVQSEGTFFKNEDATWTATYGSGYIPSGWTVQDA